MTRKDTLMSPNGTKLPKGSQYHKIPIKKEKKMDFKLTIVLTHIENQSEEDMFLNAETYIQDDIKDGVLNIESVEDITDYPDSK